MVKKQPINTKIIICAGLSVVALLLFSQGLSLVQAQTGVYQILSDYQNEPNGGDGYLRILTFNPDSDTLQVSTFSPTLNSYKSGQDSTFTLNYKTNGTNPFTIIALPDTQYYSAFYPSVFINQTSWIAQNKDTLNIIFVVHLGDIVDNPMSLTQWQNSKPAMNILEANNIPYSVLAGNHDLDDNGNQYFKQFYGEENNYRTIEYNGNKLLFLNLQYNPSDSQITWANQIVTQHPDYAVIFSTHSYLTTTPLANTN
jgi:calcineurin-like phosphoesterase family protein